MPESRPPIPVELRRRVLIEAGHRCAITTCRHIEVDVHHIVPWAQCQTHEYDNLIALCPNCHRMAEQDKIDRKSLKTYKANLRYLYDKYFPWEIDILFELSKEGEDHAIPFPPFMFILIRRIIDSGFVRVIVSESGVTIGGMKASPDYLVLTEKGRQFITDLSVSSL